MSALFDAYEQSQHDGRPVEAYQFTGTFVNYLYTSSDVLVRINNLDFEPATIRRTAIRAGTSGEDGLDIEVRMPVDMPLIQDYAFGVAPPSLTLRVYRLHRGTDPRTPLIQVPNLCPLTTV